MNRLKIQVRDVHSDYKFGIPEFSANTETSSIITTTALQYVAWILDENAVEFPKSP